MENFLEQSEAASRKFFTKELPLWLSLVSFVVLIALSSGALYYFGGIKLNYTLQVPGTDISQTAFQYGAIPALANSDYFSQVKNQFISQSASFVEADLSSMTLRVYDQGKVIKEVPIKTKGKEGSWWETPAGIYKIESKETSHFSSIGHVYQPYSMAFQGNFFIHGWPYHTDGTEVATTYSGGCIRLTTEDAKAVYDLVKVGTPVLVYEKDFMHDDFHYTFAPTIAAEKYLVADLGSDSVLFEKGLNATSSVASITKLVTALVSAEYIDLDRVITITPNVLASTSKPRLKVGQEISTYNLMFPLLMESSNEAAEAMARQIGRERFVNLMNQKAKSLGMTSSHFADPAGVSGDNVSTAQDLFALAKYIYNNRTPEFQSRARRNR
jgi:lipoprotein-anchoring transpeptidase ErfK/SrfK